MSEPFTDITDAAWDKDWAKKSLLDEIVGAVWERDFDNQNLLFEDGTTALYTDADGVPVGSDVQSVHFWKTLQEHLEDTAGLYLDIGAVPADGDIDGMPGYYPSTGEFNFQTYTTATFRTAAGLHADGWKRSTDGVTFEYGFIQAGDIIGPWILEEIMRAANVLRWCYNLQEIASESEGDNEYVSGSGYGTRETSCAGALAAGKSAWSSSASEDGVFTEYGKTDHGGDPAEYSFKSLRGGVRVHLPARFNTSDLYPDTIDTGLAASARMYGCAYAGLRTFEDVEGDGFTQNNWTLLGSLASPYSQNYDVLYRTNTPLDSVSCPVAAGEYGYTVTPHFTWAPAFTNMSTTVTGDPWD